MPEVTSSQNSYLKPWLVVFATTFAGMALGVLGLAYILAGEIYEYQDTVDGVHLPPVDAIVCLAGGRGRIAGAGDIWYRYRELAGSSAGKSGPVATAAAYGAYPVLYVSGMGPQSNWKGFSRQLRTGVRDVIRPENVVLETESFNTDANARWLARYARQHGWSRILLITSPYHMRRARHIFDRILAGPVAPGSSDKLATERPIQLETLSVFQEPFEPGEWRHNLHGIRVTMSEYLKWVYYRYFWNP